ncbi:xanthine dehydrogenase family protein subunit M [Streptomyces sp. NPDC019937]|uniref:FAD binding domain-containing protein n=1 Tax=Streptomyces sp. NPDC019937 TaxID=3154787 RepID=UPI0033F612C1
MLREAAAGWPSAVAKDPNAADVVLEAAYLAGGTNLVDLMRLEVATPEVLVDVRRLTSDRIEELPDGALRIGAAVPNSDLAADRRVRRRYPVLSQAVLSGASGQLRNLATTGGNLLQRTRCPYFQNVTTPCDKREPGSGCSALEGYQRDMAILGASSSCVATHPSDMAVALAALDAVVCVRGPQGPDGERRVPLTELHRLPGDAPERDTVLRRGELITAVELPPPDFTATSRYRKVRDRASYAFALVSVAAALDVTDSGTVRDVRIALGGVAHKPWRAWKAEESLRGAPATWDGFRDAAAAELAQADPLPGNAFKVALARNTLVATLLDLLEVAR